MAGFACLVILHGTRTAASLGFERRVLTELTDGISLPELHISLSLAAVYDGIEFSDE